jgi:hypothetical protein
MIYKYVLNVSILLWKDMAEHGYHNKRESVLFPLVKYVKGNCLLCEYFYDRTEDCFDYFQCEKCPLCKCDSFGSLWHNWRDATSTKDKSRAAQAIVDTLVAAQAQEVEANPC